MSTSGKSEASRLFLRDGESGRPLRVLITRPDEQAEETAELVRSAGGEPLLHPCLHRQPPPDPAAFAEALVELPRHDVIAVTSVNGAAALAEGLRGLGVSPGAACAGKLVAAVGARTAAALERHGIATKLIAVEDSSAEGLADVIAAELGQRGLDLRSASIFFPQALEARPTLAEKLRGQGAAVREAVAYAMVATSLERLSGMAQKLREGTVDLAPFGSPRTAVIALKALWSSEEPGRAAPEPGVAARLLSSAVVGAIGGTTAAALRSAGVRVDVVPRVAEFPVLLREMAEAWRATKRIDP